MTETAAPGPLRAILRTYRLTFRTEGRAGRAEMIWFTLYSLLVAVVLELIGWQIFEASGYNYARLAFWVLLLPGITLWVRRLHDLGASGAWICLSFLPVISQLMLFFLMLRRTSDTPRIGRNRLWPWIVLPAMALGVAKYQTFTIASGSMKPGLQVGDFIIVDVLAYGLPCFGLCGPGDRFAARAPVPGEVVVFLHPARPGTWVKRIAGLGGDEVQMVSGALRINGAEVAADPAGDFVEPVAAGTLCANDPVPPGEMCIKAQVTETLGGRSYAVLDAGSGPLDNTGPVAVPQGHVFVLGDNRDNSIDSRVPPAAGGVGTVPVSRLVGRASVIAFSMRGAAWYDPRALRLDRLWKGVQ